MSEQTQDRVAPEVRVLLGRIDEMMARVMAVGPAAGGTFDDVRAASLEATRELYEAAGGSEERRTEVTTRTAPSAAGEVPVRVYTPAGEGPFPAAVQIHGGAWTMGTPDWPTFTALCDTLAAEVPCVVVAVDYRLAPEHKFPAGLEDCHAAFAWVAEHAGELGVDPARIALVGDSAGANLAAAVALMARDRGGPSPAALLLEIPAPDHAHIEDYPSAREFGAGWGLETESLVLGRDLYFERPEDAAGAYASPGLAEDLSGLPPTLVMTAEFDPLRDNGEAFGKRLQEAGVPTTVSRGAGHIHGSSLLLWPGWEGAREWRQEAVAFLRDTLA